METIQSAGASLPAWNLLLLEPDVLVRDRLCQMARAEGFATCVVDSVDLFHALRARFAFDLLVLGVRSPAELEGLGLDPEIAPLVLLAPLQGRGGATHYRVALPEAQILDRSLRDPDALRRLLGPQTPDDVARGSTEAVRSAFEPFGLSERQLDVLRRALLGESAAQIAGRLFISELTVRNHLHAIYERVGVSGRRELLGRFVQGLIEGHA